jgi:hypothetical protein
MKYNWSEVSHTPLISNSLLIEPVSGQTDGSTFQHTLQIAPYTATVNTVYVIQLTISLTNKQISVSDTLRIPMIPSNLQG